ncbi:MAG: Nif3-like dinuclear metal center hexameric protein [Oscillospiraceae bacterium]|jgi:dinuclear metal center YbgI/SA1388 family protein|nr:Nif3-like dinuclear metal center hexameric protein [Oscillospiraceae bacterium]
MIKEIYNFIETFAPFKLSSNYDNTGILVNTNRDIKKILLSLDITKDVVKEAIETNTNLIISHHPIIFHPLKRLSADIPAVKLAAENIGVIAAHTNFDAASYGISDIMAELLGLENTGECLEEVKGFENCGYGRICTCKEISTLDLVKKVKEVFDCKFVRYIDSGKQNTRVAVCSGSGANLFPVAFEMGCDVLITGDIKHDLFVDAFNCGFSLIDAGHFYTENVGMIWLKKQLKKQFPSLDINIAEKNIDITEYL